MANYKLIIPHVKSSEGGLSSWQKDSARKYPSPIKDPKTGFFYHTNKGIIWKTWEGYSKKKGIPVNAQRWLKMSNADWEDVMKTLYWNAIYGDFIVSQGIAEILFEAIWGGSSKSLVIFLQTTLRNAGYDIAVDGAMGKNTYTALNKYTKNAKKEKQLITDMTASRLATLKSLPTWKDAASGWTRRLNEIQERAYSYVGKGIDVTEEIITKNPIKTTITAIALIGVSYYLLKFGLPKVNG